MIKKVSVIVPNYNYEQFLPQRLNSIINQTYPIYELIFIDNASTDNSVTIAKSILKNTKFPVKIIVNEYNNGNVFKQWYKGLCLAKGDYIWIAESDDYCEATFLENVIKPFDDEEVVLSYSQSAVVDENDNIIHENYLFHTQDISSDWEKSFVIDGIQELGRSLYLKCTIPNVSAVVFRKEKFCRIFNKEKENIFGFKLVGDWYTYILLSFYGRFAFCSKILNYHRTHERTVRKLETVDDELYSLKNKIMNYIFSKNSLNTILESKNIDRIKLYFQAISLIFKHERYINDKILSYLETLSKVTYISIFGTKTSGRRTYKFIKKFFPTKIKYFIDDNNSGQYKEIPIVTTYEFLEKYQYEVDIVVFGKYQHLNPKLLPNLKIPYVRLENVI